MIPPQITHGYFSIGHLNILHVILSNSFMHVYSEPLRSLSGYKILFHIEPILRQNVNGEFYLSLNESELKKISGCINDLLADAKAMEPDAKIRQSFAALLLIGKLCEEMSKLSITKTEKLLGENTISVIKSLDIYESGYDKFISVRQLAADCGMSYGKYLSDFKKLTGTTPSRYRNECRMKRAEELLRFSDETVTTIALSLGYYDSAHFIREFKTHSGVSPTSFREKISGEQIV